MLRVNTGADAETVVELVIVVAVLVAAAVEDVLVPHVAVGSENTELLASQPLLVESLPIASRFRVRRTLPHTKLLL